MKYNLPILTAVVLLVGLALLANQPPQTPNAPQTPAESTPSGNLPKSQATTDAQQLVYEAARQLALQPSLEAKIRQRIEMFGHQLAGSGMYWQAPAENGGPARLRLDLKLQVGSQVASVQQICDGRYFWSRRDMQGDVQLSRIELERVATELQKKALDPLQLARYWMQLGGMPRLLESLAHHVDFEQPQAQTIGGNVPVWVLVGRWKPATLARLLGQDPQQPLAADAAAQLPDHLPDQILLVLGRDRVFPLFPYRIEYRRRVPQADMAPAVRPLVTMELFEVRYRPDLVPQLLSYDNVTQPLTNGTEAFLNRLR